MYLHNNMILLNCCSYIVNIIISGEPALKTMDSEVFGCHYDEGRITRTISEIETEQIFAYRSTQEYINLERESGIKIFSEVGFAVTGENGDSYVGEYVKMADIFCEKNSLICEEINQKFVLQKWNYLVPPANSIGRYSKKYNGYISVRNLVTACQEVFMKSGGDRILSAASEIEKSEDGFKISLSNDEIITTKKIVLACGSFVNFFNLLPNKKLLDLQLVGHTVMKFELNEQDSKTLSGFPSMIYKPSPDSSSYLYILPPIMYPNEKCYIKFGHSVHPEYDSECIGKFVETLEDVKQWYCKTDYPKAQNHFRSYFSKLFPNINPVSEQLDFCVMAMTPSKKQYIDFIEDGILLAAGGNGKSAKFGLEIGRVCAKSILKGEWDYDLNKTQFSACFK